MNIINNLKVNRKLFFVWCSTVLIAFTVGAYINEDYRVFERSGEWIVDTAHKFQAERKIVSVEVKDQKVAQKSSPASPSASYFTYEVKKGETVYQISRRHKVDFKVVLTLNQLEIDDIVRPGDRLMIPKYRS